MKTRQLLNPIFDTHHIPARLRPTFVAYLTEYAPRPAGLPRKFTSDHPCVRECLRAMSNQFVREMRGAR